MHDPTHKLPDATPLRLVRPYVSLLFSWGEEVRALALREGLSVIVGRSEPATLIVDDKSLSRTHARIAVRDGVVIVDDLGSTNGSSINGAGVRQAILNEGDVAQFGAVELRVAARADARPHVEPALSHAEFMRQLGDELRRARLFNRVLSVVAIRVGEHDAALAAMQLPLRPVDRMCRFAPTLLLVSLVESDGRAANTWLEGLRRGAAQTWAAGLASYPALTCTAEELASHALDASHAAKAGTTVQARPSEPKDLDSPIILSPALRRVYDLVARAARATMPVLVLGETGAGKELVARALHDQSPRANAPLKALNCATIPANLMESILFGHERGAFTGADKQAQGIFEQAQGGTVFLDEIGELSPQAQAALLRVLEQRRVVRVGGRNEIEVDVRVVAATHRNLSAMVETGHFREDLMFRLDVLSLRVPPLRARAEEIMPLAELFLKRAGMRWGATAQRFSYDAVEAMLAYGWPGNVRQLKNIVERAAAVCDGDEIELDDLPEQVWVEPQSAGVVAAASSSETREGYRSLTNRVRDFETDLIRQAMEQAHGNQAQAARILGLPRRTLANKVHAYGLLG